MLHVVPDSTHKPSMMLDMENNRPIEVEAILGEIVRMARIRGVAIPVSAKLQLSVKMNCYILSSVLKCFMHCSSWYRIRFSAN